MQPLEDEVVFSGVQAFRKNRMNTETTINLNLFFKTRTSGSIDFHDQVWIVRMVQHSRIVASPQQLPGHRYSMDNNRIVRINALNLEIGKQFLIDAVN